MKRWRDRKRIGQMALRERYILKRGLTAHKRKAKEGPEILRHRERETEGEMERDVG